MARKARMGLKSSLTTAREDALVELGFEWEVKAKGDAALWEKNLSLLRKFKKEHGHCCVPRSVPGLSIWVKDRRKEKKNGKLSKERIAQLNALGFAWSARK